MKFGMNREKILHRCEILKYMGDDGIPCIYGKDVMKFFDIFFFFRVEFYSIKAMVRH